ncbi:MmgE/PrpD family protein [Ancylobacter defluvii]|uniref:2-methylcitrate dehydratase n=1 Tax=Ancylobacter defluvii TaxID=1282440 RepID=A0A9W6JYZ5_9HYPH|nr:MmgE/PrpD family protein [Ancylobacter defluvii]MBS7586564.1 MmgE/PrpD family protein [Ancylobacter defluvii]GLK85852.1 2-methylcitrate dehydratase [Ancylobacter defluvii]
MTAPSSTDPASADTRLDAGLTAAISRFAAGFDGAAIPPAMRAKARVHILDAIGCGLAGASTDMQQAILAATRIEARPGPCRVLGERDSFGPVASAFVNAAAMNALDFDDGLEDEHGRGMGHPGASLVAAALAAGFERRVSGADVVTAVALAYEVNNRLIRAMQPSIERFRLVYGVCQHQAIGAAIAYGRLIGLDADAMENALGFAGSFANVPSLRKYNWERRPLITFKDFLAPAAEAGVRGVALHHAGLVGAKAVLDGPSGLWRMLGSDQFEPERLTDGLGENWTLGFNTIKPYPACRWMHATLSAYETLLTDHAIPAEAIEAITVHTDAALLRDFMDAAPLSINDAQFSFPYTMAALALRLARPHWYDAANRTSPELKALAARVTGAVDAEASALMSGQRRPAGRVDIQLKDGTRHRSPLAVDAPGGVRLPLSDAAVRDKFRANAAVTLGVEGASDLLGLLDHIETVPDFGAALAARL